MNTKTCYRFDEKTHEYKGTDLAFQGPIELTYPLPANCTFIEPPVTGDYEIGVFENDLWVVKPDYRKHLDNTGTFVGGKPFYNPSDYWWAIEEYTSSIGDKPLDRSWDKMDKPQIVVDVVSLETQVQDTKSFLAETDYVHNVILEEPEKAEKYASVIEERKRKRASIDPTEEQITELKNQIVSLYGEEALNHIY